jgi:hypothetical protein
MKLDRGTEVPAGVCHALGDHVDAGRPGFDSAKHADRAEK